MSVGDFRTLVSGGVTPAATPPSTGTAYKGQIARAPLSDTDTMVITVPDFSMAFPYEVLSDHWMSASNLPAVNAECLALFDERGDAWVPQWDGMIPGGGGGDGGGGNIDGGFPDSVYGGTPLIDAGGI
jgi:hypothetical protein